MRIQSFIGASSAMLIAWLGATYLQRVPSERYRQHGGPTPVAGMGFGMETEMVADNETLERQRIVSENSPAKRPVSMVLEPGTYFWCACGKTSHSPFCDGSHKGSGIQPRKFEVTEKAAFTLCRCNATGNPPFCDGSHRNC